MTQPTTKEQAIIMSKYDEYLEEFRAEWDEERAGTEMWVSTYMGLNFDEPLKADAPQLHRRYFGKGGWAAAFGVPAVTALFAAVSLVDSHGVGHAVAALAAAVILGCVSGFFLMRSSQARESILWTTVIGYELHDRYVKALHSVEAASEADSKYVSVASDLRANLVNLENVLEECRVVAQRAYDAQANRDLSPQRHEVASQVMDDTYEAAIHMVISAQALARIVTEESDLRDEISQIHEKNERAFVHAVGFRRGLAEHAEIVEHEIDELQQVKLRFAAA